MGGTCSTHEINNILSENLKGRVHLRNKDADGSTIYVLKYIAIVYWIQLAHYRDQWWVLVNMVMNIGVT